MTITDIISEQVRLAFRSELARFFGGATSDGETSRRPAARKGGKRAKKAAKRSAKAAPKAKTSAAYKEHKAKRGRKPGAVGSISSRVLQAVQRGANTTSAVVTATGLASRPVTNAVNNLVRQKRLVRTGAGAFTVPVKNGSGASMSGVALEAAAAVAPAN